MTPQAGPSWRLDQQVTVCHSSVRTMAGSERRLVVNVGGTKYATSVTTLLSEANSYFTSMLGGDWAETGQQELFIDRNGELFANMFFAS